MKTNFKFFFHLILATSFLSAFIYGVAETLVEKYITVLSFGLLAIVVIGIAGMMRSLVVLSVAEVGAKNVNNNVAA
jgi:hypothetical protein